MTAGATQSARLSELVAIRNEETQRQFERMENPGLRISGQALSI